MKVQGISGGQSLEQMLSVYTARIEANAKAREKAAAPEADTLVEQLLPELDSPAAELVKDEDLAAGEAAAELVEGDETLPTEEPAAKVSLSEELEKMRADMAGFEDELRNAIEQGEAMGESMENVGKILAIFRRISKGDIVPARDEQKLMEYDKKLYAAAKQLGVMAKNKDPKRHKSVDSEEEQKQEMQARIDSMMSGLPDMPEVSAPAPEVQG